jgi:ATP-dependent Clp protease ATP-binding subunit ClpC
MWQRFTERARKVVFYAQEESGRLGDNYVSTEHLLLGLIRENDSVAARILDRLGVSLARIRTEIERQVTQGDGRKGEMQLTPRAKRVIDLAYDEARQLNNNYIGTEHILLGLIREGEGLAGRVLAKLGVDLEMTRREISEVQETSKGEPQPTPRSRPLRSHRAQNNEVNPMLSHLSELMVRAYQTAKRLKTSPGPEHLFLAVLEDADGSAARALASLGVTPEQVERAIKDLNKNDQPSS